MDSNAPQPITPAFGLVDPGQSRAAEKQKERWGGWWLSINMPPLAGFQAMARRAYERPRKMWVMSRPARPGRVAPSQSLSSFVEPR